MKALLASMALVGLVVTSAAAQSPGTSNRDCKVVQLKPGETAPSGGLSTSITAGGGKVTGTVTGPGGTTTHSSSGSGSVATSSSSDGRTTIVTDSSGNCTIYQSAK